ncbi:MAG TPA: AIR synthase family protein [Candidatus Bathyarchaeia archaeon]|nr:AIR synthase family protein [Candidatus Bathyarchaeia archaeon]
MRRNPRFGKVGQEILSNVIYKSLGASRPQIIVGPRFGVDNSVIQLEPNRVLVATTDPLSYIPSLGPDLSAWLSVHLLASDLTTSGFHPQYGLFDFNLPPSLNDTNFRKYWKAFHNEWKRLGLSIIGGHTGRYPGLDYTIIGGGMVMATGRADRYLTASMANDGDDLVLTKGAAIEATAVLTRAFPRRVRKAVGPKLFDKAWNYVQKVTTVEDALTAVKVGVRDRGITAMHDATEGGVMAGLIELASASDLGATIELARIEISDETRSLCRLFRIDPMTSLSEGSLVIACRPSRTQKLLADLSSRGIRSRVVGRLTSKFRGCKASGKPLHYPTVDPYWMAYFRAIEKGWA